MWWKHKYLSRDELAGFDQYKVGRGGRGPAVNASHGRKCEATRQLESSKRCFRQPVSLKCAVFWENSKVVRSAE